MVMASLYDHKIKYMVMSRDEFAGKGNSANTLKRWKSSNTDKINILNYTQINGR